jgi:hypothetical protein
MIWPTRILKRVKEDWRLYRHQCSMRLFRRKLHQNERLRQPYLSSVTRSDLCSVRFHHSKWRLVCLINLFPAVLFQEYTLVSAVRIDCSWSNQLLSLSLSLFGPVVVENDGDVWSSQVGSSVPFVCVLWLQFTVALKSSGFFTWGGNDAHAGLATLFEHLDGPPRPSKAACSAGTLAVSRCFPGVVVLSWWLFDR